MTIILSFFCQAQTILKIKITPSIYGQFQMFHPPFQFHLIYKLIYAGSTLFQFMGDGEKEHTHTHFFYCVLIKIALGKYIWLIKSYEFFMASLDFFSALSISYVSEKKK
jgi:hypothetical protein